MLEDWVLSAWEARARKKAPRKTNINAAPPAQHNFARMGENLLPGKSKVWWVLHGMRIVDTHGRLQMRQSCSIVKCKSKERKPQLCEVGEQSGEVKPNSQQVSQNIKEHHEFD